MMCILITCFHCKHKAADSEEASAKGLSGLGETRWSDPSLLYRGDKLTVAKLTKYIQLVLDNDNKEFRGSYAGNLARAIYSISKEIGIDPVIFAGLIAHESRFDPTAINKNKHGVIGGSGLTQLTTIAVKEINDQWSGLKSAHSPYVHKFIKAVDESLHDGDFIKIPSPKYAIEPKYRISSLYYGGLLLKIFLTNLRQNPKAMSRCLIPKDRKLPKGLFRDYRATLACYNGHKVNMLTYADKVGVDIKGMTTGVALTGETNANDPDDDDAYASATMSNSRDILDSIEASDLDPDADPDSANEETKDEISENFRQLKRAASVADQCWSIQIYAIHGEPELKKIQLLSNKVSDLLVSLAANKDTDEKSKYLKSVAKAGLKLYSYENHSVEKNMDFTLFLLGKFGTFRDAEFILNLLKASDKENQDLQDSWLRLTNHSTYTQDIKGTAPRNFCSSEAASVVKAL
jgi:hypothetical protein